MRDQRVDDYIAAAAPFARPILKRLRRLVRQGCPEAVETIKWSCPHFVHRDSILCNMAAFKEHCAFGFWHREMGALIAREGGRADDAMGQFGRISGVADLPDDAAITGYVRAAARLIENGGAPRPRAVRGAATGVAVPPALAAALRRNEKAGRHFKGMSPSHRREYSEWVAGAKQEATRKRRVATAIEWLAAGKSLNWRYQRQPASRRSKAPS